MRVMESLIEYCEEADYNEREVSFVKNLMNFKLIRNRVTLIFSFFMTVQAKDLQVCALGSVQTWEDQNQ